MSEDYKGITGAVQLLKSISNESRLLILCRLSQEQLSVNELAAFAKLSQSAVSQHLAKLREAKLVTTRREQQTIYYSLDSKVLKAIIGVLHNHYCSTGK